MHFLDAKKNHMHFPFQNNSESLSICMNGSQIFFHRFLWAAFSCFFPVPGNAASLGAGLSSSTSLLFLRPITAQLSLHTTNNHLFQPRQKNCIAEASRENKKPNQTHTFGSQIQFLLFFVETINTFKYQIQHSYHFSSKIQINQIIILYSEYLSSYY